MGGSSCPSVFCPQWDLVKDSGEVRKDPGVNPNPLSNLSGNWAEQDASFCHFFLHLQPVMANIWEYVLHFALYEQEQLSTEQVN